MVHTHIRHRSPRHEVYVHNVSKGPLSWWAGVSVELFKGIPPPGADTCMICSHFCSSLFEIVFWHFSRTSFFRLLALEPSQDEPQMDKTIAENWCRLPSRKTFTQLYVFVHFVTFCEKVHVSKTLQNTLQNNVFLSNKPAQHLQKNIEKPFGNHTKIL